MRIGFLVLVLGLPSGFPSSPMPEDAGPGPPE